MQLVRSRGGPGVAAAVTVALLAAMLAACANSPSKEEQEAAKNTFACQMAGERLVMKFDIEEVRLLMPDGDRVVLYRIPSPSGIRYTNGTFDLRGRGVDVQLIRNGTPMVLVDCQPYLPPK
jgi:membrane-bound inhibitor of C-type lysozyme